MIRLTSRLMAVFFVLVLPVCAEASALYRTLGFQPIDAYCYNPLPGAMYFELK